MGAQAGAATTPRKKETTALSAPMEKENNMEKEAKKTAMDKTTQPSSSPKPDGLLVTIFKRLLDINFIKWGKKRDF